MIPGRVIDEKYRVRRVIGRGGMSVVAEAEDLKTGGAVAIKFLRTDVARALCAEPRFFREARLAARLRSKHTCRVADVGVWDSGPYLVLELLEGRTLSQELRVRKTLSTHEACEIILQACDALAEAHALGIVHRDIKPGNFFLCANASESVHLKVLDFGVAKIPASVVTRNGEGSLTDGNTLIGTPSYVSPEQLQNSKLVDPRTDVWGLGVILYEMLAGFPPFRDPWVPRLLVKISREPHIPLREVCPGVARELDRIVERCLSKNPANRYRGAADLGLALSDLEPPPDFLLDRLMAFSTSMPNVASFTSRPPQPDSLDDIKIELGVDVNQSIDPFTTAIGRRSRSRWLPSPTTAALGGVLAGGVLAFAWLGFHPHAHDQLRSTVGSRSLQLASLSAPTTRLPTVADKVRIELYATPAETQWWLDGKLLGSSPLDEQLPRDLKTHTLTARANNYESRSLTVYLDRDVSLSLALDRATISVSEKAARVVPAPKAISAAPGRPLDSNNPYGGSNR
jgi:eukaryotic-like serine/threonine-protein kinase